jgi:hypothetical protein
VIPTQTRYAAVAGNGNRGHNGRGDASWAFCAFVQRTWIESGRLKMSDSEISFKESLVSPFGKTERTRSAGGKPFPLDSPGNFFKKGLPPGWGTDSLCWNFFESAA